MKSLADIVSEAIEILLNFFGVWFKKLESNTYQVEVTNPQKQQDFSKLERRLAKVAESIEKISQDKNTDAKLKAQIGYLLQGFKSTNQKVEVTNWKLPKLNIPNVLRVDGDVRVSNLPKTQVISGTVNVKDFSNLVQGIQVVVNGLESLKLEIRNKEFKGGGGTVTAVSTGSHKEKVPGTIWYDPDSDRPIYIGTNETESAADSEPHTTIIKTTYSGSSNKITKQERRVGSWADRATLF